MHENKRDLRTRLPGKTQYAKQCFLAMTTELKSNEKTRQNTYKLLFSSAVRLLLLFHEEFNQNFSFWVKPGIKSLVLHFTLEPADRFKRPCFLQQINSTVILIEAPTFTRETCSACTCMDAVSPHSYLKGSYDVAKNNIIWCIWCNAMCFKVQKAHYFPHTVHYCCSSMLRLSEKCQFLQSSSF